MKCNERIQTTSTDILEICIGRSNKIACFDDFFNECEVDKRCENSLCHDNTPWIKEITHPSKNKKHLQETFFIMDKTTEYIVMRINYDMFNADNQAYLIKKPLKNTDFNENGWSNKFIVDSDGKSQKLKVIAAIRIQALHYTISQNKHCTIYGHNLLKVTVTFSESTLMSLLFLR